MTIDREMQVFQADLMEAVRDMKAGRAARVTHVVLSPAADARAKTGLGLPVGERQGKHEQSGFLQSMVSAAYGFCSPIRAREQLGNWLKR